MNGLDLVAVVLAAAAAFGGWRLGFLRRLSGWIGAASGIALAIVIAPGLVDRLSLADDTSIVVLCTALMVLLASLGQGLGALVGSRLASGVDTSTARAADAAGGAALGLLGVLVIAWLIVPVMADAQGWSASAARNSALARFVDSHLPAPPPQITELEQQLMGGSYPKLFTGLRSAPEVPDVPAGAALGNAAMQSAARSAVRLEGQACSRLQSGSGFFVAPGVVATNAHVVAGTRSLSLDTAEGESGSGVVISFDPAIDLALVATDIDRPPLTLAAPSDDDRGAVLGFPGGGDFDPSPFAVAQRISATGFDIYDADTIERDLLVLAAQLEPGDSGSAVLRNDGTVIGVAVAVAPDSADVAYALDSSELVSVIERGADREVSTGDCSR